MIDVRITEGVLDVAASYRAVASPESGGINIFVGSVRSKTAGRAVKHLFFEAYEKMAINEMKKIAKRSSELWQVHNILIHHRVGQLEINEVPVIVAVSSAHRKDAIKASHFLIDELKATVPIWKKEVFENGEEWVTPHP